MVLLATYLLAPYSILYGSSQENEQAHERALESGSSKTLPKKRQLRRAGPGSPPGSCGPEAWPLAVARNSRRTLAAAAARRVRAR